MKYIQHIKFSATILVGDKKEELIMSTLSFGEDALDVCLKKFFDEIDESGSVIIHSITRDENSYGLLLENTEFKKEERYASAKLKIVDLKEFKVGE